MRPVRWWWGVAAGLALAATGWLGAAIRLAPYDVLVRGGRVVDGTGNPWHRADVAVRGDAIAAIAPVIRAGARREIDAADLIVSPGFIDIHSHARRGIFRAPDAPNYVRQGVTTIIEGPDGGSPVPLGPFLERLAATRPAVNVGSFIGQGSIRELVIGTVDRRATAAELARMEVLVRDGMRDGAFGLSSGLLYVPGAFTPPDEIAALARVAGELGGIYISHMRDEAAGVLDSVRETIAVGERAGLPVQITHHKIVGVPNWGLSARTLRLVAEARALGVDVTIDQYPYAASSTSITVLLPGWALEGGRDALRARLQDPSHRARIHAAIVENLRHDRGGGDPARVVIAACEWDPSLTGRSLADLTRARGFEPGLTHAADTVLDLVERGGAQGVFHAMDEADVERILGDAATMVASDGGVPMFGEGMPHPRSYGTFVRVLGWYVRERRVLGLEDAVRKMSALPAQRLTLVDRGLLRPGMKADLAIWDPERVRDRATFDAPHQYAEGITHVLVNGELVLDQGRATGARPGRVLRGPAFVPEAGARSR